MKPIASVAALASLFCATVAHAGMLDLTYDGANGYINGAYFMEGTLNPTGTGVYEPFLRLQRVGVEQGYNTSGSKVLDNKDAIWTRDLRFDSTVTVEVKGVKYREFRLDINEPASSNSRYLSLDELRIYLEPNGGITTMEGLTNKKYDMGENWVKLDYVLNKGGSGWDDMSVFIPDSVFTGSTANPYLYLYSKFGVHNSAEGGYEEWATDPPSDTAAVPEPASLLLLGSGAVALLRRRRRS